jgi:xanthine dehydrogenase accessory factor
VEADAIDAAKKVMAEGGRSLRSYELTEDLAWNSGLVCGGTMWILAERGDDALTIDGRDVLEDLVQAAEGHGHPLAVTTTYTKTARHTEFVARTIAPVDGAPTARVASVDERHDQLIDVVAGKPRVIIAGGGHVSLAIYRQAMLLDFDVTVLEDRPHFAGKARFPGAEVIEADVAQTIASLDYGWHSYLVIATRGHKMDGDCVLAALRTNARYVGLLGSRRKKALIEQMLRDEGLPAERISVVRSPIGLNLGGRTPAEIALAIMAEIVQERYQCER